jgi:predicted PurR-regulated permease PerM
LQPVIYSRSVKAHPIEIFLVVIMAGMIAGPFGMILAIPAYTLIRIIAMEFFKNWSFVSKATQSLGTELQRTREHKEKDK